MKKQIIAGLTFVTLLTGTTLKASAISNDGPVNEPTEPNTQLVNLKCVVSQPFDGVKVTNNSKYGIPSNTPIFWNAFNASEKFQGTIKGGLPKGATKNAYVPNSQYNLQCKAWAEVKLP